MFDKSRNVVVTGGTFTQVVGRENDSFRLLQEAVSPAAFHDSGARYDAPKCYPNTRLAVLERIRRWVKGLDAGTRDTSVMWLHGPAGAGKSAIAQTIAEAFSDEGEILASYFFSRLDPTRNHARSLIATIAYQICIHFPTVRSTVEGTIRADPLLLTRSMSTQMLHLIVHPLEELVVSGYFLDSKSRRLIVIDGLDECNRRNGQKDVLHSIADTLQNIHLPLKILIASRPEHDIVHAFSSGYFLASSTRLALDDQYKPSADIELFLRGKFSEIKSNHPIKQHIPLDWPTDEAVNFLVDKSSGQFIYASTISRFIESARHSPLSRLEIVLGIRPSEKGQKMPFGELDALYHHIFGSVEDTQAVLKLLAVVILWELTQVDQLESLLGLSPGSTQLLLCDIQSLCFVEYSFRGAHMDYARKDYTSSLYQILKHASPLSQAPGYYYDRRAADVIFFLWALQRSALPWAEEVYRHHIQSLHDYVKKQLGDYFSDPHITCMILLSTREETSLVFDRDSPRHLRFWLQWLSQPRKTDSAETLRSKSLLHLAVSLRTPDTATMSAILNDRADLGGYAIDHDRMRVAALYLLKLIQKYSRCLENPFTSIPHFHVQTLAVSHHSQQNADTPSLEMAKNAINHERGQDIRQQQNKDELKPGSP
ncbi:LOW QUALITY PROTEIN: hypothetical protein CVT26_012574 [Gymnopilus dilepis]|uniref:Nephrocystin 3-like N-terminal domain-containing protein n=1 Tax=Gymnopilus dilepis TaxID=231916 RepID=A0A409YPS4_9AGAR|nr:LOW QUALITY PROTEIN: hypothetical protein CVT26_012574 [Gymnopilus dilepis]